MQRGKQSREVARRKQARRATAKVKRARRHGGLGEPVLGFRSQRVNEATQFGATGRVLVK